MDIGSAAQGGKEALDKATSCETIGSEGGAMFVRNTLASFLCFGVDVALLYGFIEWLGITYLIAATIAFLIAITLHYAISCMWIFPDSDRGKAAGYVFFLVNAGIGLVLTLATMALLVELAGLHYLFARVAASAVAGVAVFLLNAKFNFRAL